MRDDQELSIDQLSAVIGGMTNNNNGSLPHPKPPVDIIKWILSLLK
jgi:bacteriocin-like protein